MLVMTGFFDKERFFPDIPVSIPRNKRVTVTIEEKTEKPVKQFSQAEKDLIRKSLFVVLPPSIDLNEAREELFS